MKIKKPKKPPVKRISAKYVAFAKINGRELTDILLKEDFPFSESYLENFVWSNLHRNSAYWNSPYVDYYCYIALLSAKRYFRKISHQT